MRGQSVCFRFKMDVEAPLRRPHRIGLKTGMYRGLSVLGIKILVFLSLKAVLPLIYR
ncbi:MULTISPECIES: hypothetical protein [unclassified Bartonella]|uniref:hypothetical protein n=1 Tax=unclassified Bartonella TaxID=2645622 RepID=UPI0035D0A73D